MERIGTVERKTRTRVFDEGNFRGFTEYLIESEPGARPAPQAFLVHQAPGWKLATHYHLEEQFQVVVGGGGTLGTHALAPVTLHYTTRETGYGPLVAGEQGLDYLSLRAVTDPGAWYLPESREKMRRGLRKRQATVGPIPVRAGGGLAQEAAACETLIAPDVDGLAAWLVRLPAAGRSIAPPQDCSGGRFHVVVGGSLRVGTDELGTPACIWRDAGDAPLPLHAGAQGLALLVLQYPAAALAPEPQQMPGAAAT
jgi:hypothetical protein